MNLLFAKIFGKFWSTPKIEEYITKVKGEVNLYHNFDKTAHYPQYSKLLSLTTNPDFVNKKRYLQNRKYKDTDEYKKMAAYKQLASCFSVRFYLYLLKKEAVQQYIKNVKEGKQDLATVSKSYAVRKFKSYHQSKEVKQYFALKEEIADAEFKKKNAFWSNPQRWNMTEEAKLEQEFITLCKIDEIASYRKINKERVLFYDKLVPQTEENYTNENIENTIWRGGFYYRSEAMKVYHSSVDQCQAFNEGKNIVIKNGILSILFRKEEKDQIAWGAKGFINHHYFYTSDIINTGKTLSIHKGMIIMKIRSEGTMHHSITLQNADLHVSDNNKNRNVILFHSCKNDITVGIQEGQKKDIERINGIKANDWYYYFFIWNERELIWLVNNYEVCRRPNTLGAGNYYLQATSYLPKSINGKNDISATNGKLQIAFTGVYSPKEEIQRYIYNN